MWRLLIALALFLVACTGCHYPTPKPQPLQQPQHPVVSGVVPDCDFDTGNTEPCHGMTTSDDRPCMICEVAKGCFAPSGYCVSTFDCTDDICSLTPASVPGVRRTAGANSP